MRRAVLLLLVLVAATGCGSSRSSSRAVETAATAAPPGATTTAPAATTATAPAEAVVRAYLVRDGMIAPVGRSVPRTEAVARAALVQLLTGPTADEASAGLTTDIPGDTRLLGVTIADGTATVDLTHAFAEGAEATISPRLAQVVYTLTQFPSVTSVRFQLDGSAFTAVTDGAGVPLQGGAATRADYEALTPPLLVESPLPGETVTSPLHISGSANAFEATFQAELVDAGGSVLVRRTVMATSGSGERGTFAETLRFAGSGPGKLVVYEDSAADGSRIHQVTIPLRLG